MYVDFCDTRLCAPLACGVRYTDICQQPFNTGSGTCIYITKCPETRDIHHSTTHFCGPSLAETQMMKDHRGQVRS
jgi:hypothetical protein